MYCVNYIMLYYSISYYVLLEKLEKGQSSRPPPLNKPGLKLGLPHAAHALQVLALIELPFGLVMIHLRRSLLHLGSLVQVAVD